MSDGGPVIGGLARTAAEDFLEVAAPYVDAVKFRASLPFIFPEESILDRIALYKEHDVIPYTGGILSEMAVLQDKYEEMLKGVKAMGFEMIEISENFVTLDTAQRESMTKRAVDYGLKVIFEWGRKYPEQKLNVQECVDEIKQLVSFGVWRVVLERAEIDLLKDKHADELKQIVEAVGMDDLVLEAGPGKWPEYPVWLLKMFGNEVSLSNLVPVEVVRLEEFRRGLDRQVGYWFVEGGCKL